MVAGLGSGGGLVPVRGERGVQPQRALLDETADGGPQGEDGGEPADVEVGVPGVPGVPGVSEVRGIRGTRGMRGRLDALGAADGPDRPGIGGAHESPDVVCLVAQERHGSSR